jgi:RNA polymerase sigma factor (sigma-70 family)
MPPRLAHDLARLDLDRARRFCRRLLGDAHLAEDVVQEGCLRVMERATPALRAEDLDRYFFRTLTNLSLNALARRHRRDASLNAAAPAASKAASPDRAAETVELASRAEAALDRLPDRQRCAVVLRVREAMSHREVGDLLGVSEVNAATLVYRGLKRLRELLGEGAGAGAAS